jgi:DNA-directed RNA polymerase subunit RPC12/RpoP
MPQAVNCSQCKAPVTDDRWINCPYCGALLAKPVLNPNKAVVAPERFAAVESSPEYASLKSYTPSATAANLELGGGVAAALAFTGIAAVATAVFAQSSPVVAIVPAFITLVGLITVVYQLATANKQWNAPIDRHVLVWRDERTVVSGGGQHSRATTKHYVLLEDRDGRRAELACSSQLAGAHAPGDIGVAFLRGGFLLDFKRVAV